MKIKRKACKADVPAVAQGDIAFNLLIFLMILASPDASKKWQPATAPKVERGNKAICKVLIDEEGKTYINGQPVAEAALSTRVGEYLKDVPSGKRLVGLMIHKTTKAQQFEPVIEAISEAGGELLHVLKEEKTESGP